MDGTHGAAGDGSAVPPQFAALALSHREPFAQHQPDLGWGHLDDPGVVVHPVEYSLIFVVDMVKRNVLLGLKRRGMGVNLYNGFGGKMEPSETMLECAERELCQEESGLTVQPHGLLPKGHLYSFRPRSPRDPGDKAKVLLKIHFFVCMAWSGQPIVTEEMSPEWFDIEEESDGRPGRSLPLDRMWPEASIYLRPVLQSVLQGRHDQLFFGRIDYDMLTSHEAPTNLPPLDGPSLWTQSRGLDPEGTAERLSGWWMCLTDLA
ncbi:hypothetical protein IAU60_001831 [Kwoniella sp. DSM 27419]